MSYRWVVRDEQIGDRQYTLECIEDFEAEVAAFCDRMQAEGRSYGEFEDLCPMFGAMWPAARAPLAGTLLGLARGTQHVDFRIAVGLASIILGIVLLQTATRAPSR